MLSVFFYAYIIGYSIEGDRMDQWVVRSERRCWGSAPAGVNLLNPGADDSPLSPGNISPVRQASEVNLTSNGEGF